MIRHLINTVDDEARALNPNLDVASNNGASENQGLRENAASTGARTQGNDLQCKSSTTRFKTIFADLVNTQNLPI